MNLSIVPALVILSATTLSQQSATDLPVERWQSLSREVAGVFIGPDQRLWYEMVAGDTNPTLEEIRDRIVQQYPLKNPQIAGAHPVLFEQSGRVWFLCQNREILLGYDGKTWIGHRCPDGNRFVGNCPGHGQRYPAGTNATAVDSCWFPDSRGIHRFDGEQWTYHRLTAADDPADSYPLLVTSAKGDALAAAIPKTNKFWVFRKDRWIAFESEKKTSTDGIVALAMSSPDQVWCLTQSGRLDRLDSVTPRRERFLELVNKLSDKNFFVRERATKQLIDMGATIKDLVADVLSNTKKPEVKTRLEFVSARLRPVASQSTLVDDYRIEKVRALHQLGKAGLCFAAESILNGDREMGPGFLLLKPDGTTRLFRNASIPGTRILSGLSTDGPQLWLSRPSGVTAMELNGDPKTTHFPDGRFVCLHAVTKDGVVFASREWPESGIEESLPLMQFQPRGTVGQSLKVTTIPLGSRPVAVAEDDGTIWAHHHQLGLASFDGQKWKSHKQLNTGTGLLNLLAGTGGVAVAEIPGKTGVLVTPKRTYTRGGALFPNFYHQSVILKAFPPSRRAGKSAPDYAIVSDKYGHIHGLFRGHPTASVHPTKAWADQWGYALKFAGSRHLAIDYICPVGDGSRLFLTNFRELHEGGGSFLYARTGGNSWVARTVHTCEPREMRLSIRDDEGALWVPGSIRKAEEGRDLVTGQMAYRITEKGAVDKIKNAGWARLLDQSGYIWLGSIWQQPSSRFHLWKEGKIEHTLEIPKADRTTYLCSDQKGSVYAWTPDGLQHLESMEDANYKPTTLYRTTNVGGRIIRMEYSRLGYLAAVAEIDERYYLHLLHLPSRPE